MDFSQVLTDGNKIKKLYAPQRMHGISGLPSRFPDNVSPIFFPNSMCVLAEARTFFSRTTTPSRPRDLERHHEGTFAILF